MSEHTALLSCDRLTPRSTARSLARLAYGSFSSGPRYLAVIAYCDESYDDTGRVFTLAAILADQARPRILFLT